MYINICICTHCMIPLAKNSKKLKLKWQEEIDICLGMGKVSREYERKGWHKETLEVRDMFPILLWWWFHGNQHMLKGIKFALINM